MCSTTTTTEHIENTCHGIFLVRVQYPKSSS